MMLGSVIGKPVLLRRTGLQAGTTGRRFHVSALGISCNFQDYRLRQARCAIARQGQIGQQ